MDNKQKTLELFEKILDLKIELDELQEKAEDLKEQCKIEVEEV